MGSGRRAVGSWARADLRARWVSLVALGLLAGVTAGFALAALAGAIRTDTALDRLRERERGADAIVFASQVGQIHPDWAELAAAPEVDTVAPWALVFGAFGGSFADAAGGGPGLIFASVDGRYLHDTNRPVVVEGRMYDPEAPEEVVVDENTPDVQVGDVIPFHAYGPTQEPGGGAATGPALRLRVVGRVKTMAQFLFVPGGQVLASPALIAQRGDEMVAIENADVRLVHGAGDAAALERTVNRVIAPGTPILDLNDTARRVETTMSVERTALFTLAAVVALVGLVLIGQALGRSASVIADDAPVLRAVGMTRADLSLAATVPHVLAAAVAVAAALVTAVAASFWFPVGVAGRVDPDRGVHPTWGVFATGLVVLAVLLLGAAALVSRLALRPSRSAPRVAGRGLVARARDVFPLSVGIGTTMAFQPGVGRARVPVRPALIGAIVGVLGVTGAMTINRGLEDALDHPERAGVVWDAEVTPLPDQVTSTGIDSSLVADVAAIDGVASTTIVDRALVEVEGIGVPTYALRPTDGSQAPAVALATTAGRAPTAAGEIALGPDTANRLDVGIGDTVRLGDGRRELRVVGEALFPTDVHASFDDGAWLTADGLDAVFSRPTPDSPSTVQRGLVATFEEHAPRQRTVAAIQAAVGDRAEAVGEAPVPPELTNLRDVRTLPIVLAVFLALVAIAALAHVLATSARRRGREFAVLRALGVTSRSVRSVLNAQGTAVALVGLVVGVPLGIALGRVGWRLVAQRVPLTDVAPFAALALVLVVPLTVVIANVAAVWPGRRVAHQQPATVLRTE